MDITPMNKERLQQIINGFQNKRVAVIGDLMLDTYVWGKVSRISPEAPVPVVHVKKVTHTLGGAANVMRNITSLGGNAVAFGVIGSGENSSKLLNLLKKEHINLEYIYTDPKYTTIEKQRIIAESQQLARVDYEDTDAIQPEAQEAIVNSIKKLIKSNKLDAVIFEDYAKGLINSEMISVLIDEANKHGIITALDPHPTRKLIFKNITLITPNFLEAATLAGHYQKDVSDDPINDKTISIIAEKLNSDWNVKNLLITLGAKGMILFEKGKDVKHIPTKAKEVFDVTGAGDTVIATYVMSLLGNSSGFEAAEISNNAAGIVVGRIGTSSVTPSELIAL